MATQAERQRRYRERHPQRVIENHRAYRERHRPIVRQKQRISERDRRERARRTALEVLGARCAECGFDDPRALHIDHVTGGGYREFVIEFRKNIVKYLQHVIASASSGRYQVLCANHNHIKEWERKRQSRMA